MENKSIAATLATKFISVEGTIEGPLPTADGTKQYMKVSLQISDDDDDGYSGQSRAYVKCFFEDSHSLQYQKALLALEKNLPVKIKGAKISKDLFIDGQKRNYFLTEENGKTHRKNKDGDPIISNRLAGFFLSDENPESYFNNQIKKLTKAGLWCELAEEGDPEIVI